MIKPCAMSRGFESPISIGLIYLATYSSTYTRVVAHSTIVRSVIGGRTLVLVERRRVTCVAVRRHMRPAVSCLVVVMLPCAVSLRAATIVRSAVEGLVVCTPVERPSMPV